MKSPLPTAFAILLAAVFGLGAIIGGIALVVEWQPAWFSADVAVAAILGMLFYPLLGVLAGLRYRGARKVLNRIGWGGNLLLFLVLLGLLSASLWQTHQQRASGQIERMP